MCDELIEEIVEAHCDAEKDPEQTGTGKRSRTRFFKQFNFRPNFKREPRNERRSRHARRPGRCSRSSRVKSLYDQRETEFTEPVMRQIEKIVSLQTLDSLWKDHLLAMDHLKEGIGLRGYAQQNPLVEYQKEGFDDVRSADGRDADRTWSRRSFRCRSRREQDVAADQSSNSGGRSGS